MRPMRRVKFACALSAQSLHAPSVRKRACAFDPRLRAPTPHLPGVGGCAGPLCARFKAAAKPTQNTFFFKNCESRPTEGACKLCALRAHANLLGALSALCTCMCPQCPLYLQGLHGCPQCPLYLQGLHGCPQCPRLRHRLRHSPTDPMTPPCVTPWTFLVSRMVGK